MKRILILGKQSPIAVAIFDILIQETDWKVFLELDNFDSESSKSLGYPNPILYDKKSLRKTVMDFSPNYIINCISIDDPDYIEENKKLAWDYNVGTVEALSKSAFMTESKLVMFSSDKIYNGLNGPYHEEHLPEPVNYYGKTKLGCENHCISNNVPYLSVRLPEYYGNNNVVGNNIFYRIINNEKVKLAVNSFTSPVLIDDIALAVFKMLDKDKYGFYNLAGADYISEFEYGSKVVEYLGLDKNLIEPYTYQYEKDKAKKLLRGGLVNLKSETDLNMKFVNLHSGLTTVRFQINYDA